MKILVCIKQILDPHGITVNRKAEKVFINREDYVIDPASKAALEIARSIKRSDDEVIAISIGSARLDEALREAIGRGADRSILIETNDQLDSFVVANLLAAAIQKIGGVDLVLCGDRSLDTGDGEVAARVAEALDLPVIQNVVKAEVNEQTLNVVVKENEFINATTSLPAVLSIDARAFTGSYADARRLVSAYKDMSIEVWNANELGLDENDLKPRSIKKEDAFPPERQLGVKVRNAKELMATLKRERIIA